MRTLDESEENICVTRHFLRKVFISKFLVLYYIRLWCLIAIATTISTILADRDDDVAEGGRTRQPDGREARKEGKLPLLALV